MKLSKDQETEITKVYKTYFDSYVNGDAGTIADLLDDDYNQIGSADGEVFYNKKDALKFLHDTIDQVAGKTQLRNREIRVDPLGGYYLVTDLFDIYVLIDKDWSFYARLRASTLMQKQKEGWKFIHQHSSMPDSKTPEGGNISIEKIAEENLQLREAVKRRTIELEQKNRELEIEASLERVRSRTMAMYNSEELNQLIGQIYIELSGLDMVLTRTTLFIMEPDQKSTRWWMANSETPSEPVNFLVPFHTHPPYLEWLEAWQKGEEKWVYHLEGKVKEEWDAYIFSETEVSQLPDQVIEGMRKRNHVILTASCGDFGDRKSVV